MAPPELADDDEVEGRPPMARRALSVLWRALFVVFATLLLAEGGARLYYRGNPPSLFSQRSVFQPSASELAVYEYRPSQTFGDGLYQINSHGFRGPETTRDKPADVYRIVALGDSYTFGPSVEHSATWTQRLARELSRRIQRKVEVLNFGVQGYNTRNELGRLEQHALAFEPDMVIVGHLVFDDLWSFIRMVRGQMVFFFEEDPDDRIPLPSGLKQLLYRRSLLYRLATVAYLRRFEEQIRAEQKTARSRQQDLAISRYEGWERSPELIDGESLREIHRHCAEAGIELVIVDFPVTPNGLAGTKDGEAATVSESLQALAAELGVVYIDLYPDLEGRDGGNLRIAPRDHHPNARLQRIYARRIANRLAKVVDFDAP